MEIEIYIEIPVTVEVDATPGSPGKLYGPWEDSYPPEPPEVDVTGIDEKRLLKEALKFVNAIPEDELLEYVNEGMVGRYEYAMEQKADQIREDRMMGRG